MDKSQLWRRCIHPTKGYVTYQGWNASELMPLIGFGRLKLMVLAGTKIVNVTTDSQRLECFKRNPTCIVCGRTGDVFLLQSVRKEVPHLNFYHVDDNRQHHLMTKDHITPKAHGGKDKMSNLQTMCSDCNGKKGSRLDFYGPDSLSLTLQQTT